jgi:hypothetical protein
MTMYRAALPALSTTPALKVAPLTGEATTTEPVGPSNSGLGLLTGTPLEVM